MSNNFMSLTDLATAKIKKQDFITVKEAATRNKISPTFVYWLIKTGRIKNVYKLGNQYGIPSRWRYVNKRKGDKHDPRNKSMLALNNPDPMSEFVKKQNNI